MNSFKKSSRAQQNRAFCNNYAESLKIFLHKETQSDI